MVRGTARVERISESWEKWWELRGTVRVERNSESWEEQQELRGTVRAQRNSKSWEEQQELRGTARVERKSKSWEEQRELRGTARVERNSKRNSESWEEQQELRGIARETVRVKRNSKSWEEQRELRGRRRITHCPCSAPGSTRAGRRRHWVSRTGCPCRWTSGDHPRQCPEPSAVGKSCRGSTASVHKSGCLVQTGIIYATKLTSFLASLTPSLSRPVQFLGWKMHRRTCKQYIFQSYNTSTFKAMHYDENPLTCQYEKEDKKD